MTENLPTLKESQGPATIEDYANNLDQQLSVAQIMLKSGILGTKFKTAEGVLGAVWYGKELGWSPVIACRYIDVIQGQPSVNAAGLQALAERAGGTIKTLELTDKICRVKITRGTHEDEFEYTWADATQAQLTGKDNWKKMPKDMLYARAVSRGVRRMFQDVIGGLYGAEEMRDAAPIQQDPNYITVDQSTGEVIEKGKAPPAKPKQSKRVDLDLIRDAVDGEDLSFLGDWQIKTESKGQGKTVRELVENHREWVKAAIQSKSLQKADHMALKAYYDATDDLPDNFGAALGPEFDKLLKPADELKNDEVQA